MLPTVTGYKIMYTLRQGRATVIYRVATASDGTLAIATPASGDLNLLE